MYYDKSSKILIEKCREAILRRLVGIPVAESDLLEEVPTETVSSRHTDAAIRVTDENGKQEIIILEVQSRWDNDVPLRLLEYRCRYMLKYHQETTACVLLFRPSASVSDQYEDKDVLFRFRLIPVYEFDAREIFQEGTLCLMPLLPLMRHGEEFLDQADKSIGQSSLSRKDKADLLTIMAILAGLVSKDMTKAIISKRRDIMLESAAYEVIREIEYNEGRLAGILEGKLEGKLEGRLEGKLEGKLEGELLNSRRMLIETLKLRFSPVPSSIIPTVEKITDLDTLDSLFKTAVTAGSLDEFLREMGREMKN
ncbi:MAG: hypothetical protein HQK58_17770 [Deltaproteobacteria bacterium]|nr:hypothetical protein [Deltaproteobacteria bacterium]MBF0525046.1 hypothetical protein [Deltaproteobacteria bacterium]